MQYRRDLPVAQSNFNLIVWTENSCLANLFAKLFYPDMAFQQMWRLLWSLLRHVIVVRTIDVKTPAAGAAATRHAHSTWHFENMHQEPTSFWTALFTGQVELP
jgi:hypothetical protein